MVYTSPNFLLKLKEENDKLLLTQQILHPAVNTCELPKTLSVLTNTLPSIFTNKCYNYKGLPFKKEVQATQVGHLLEHLILENLKIMAMKEFGKACYRGETSWDWIQESYGKFNIVIESDAKSKKFYKEAIKNAIEVLEEIYKN